MGESVVTVFCHLKTRIWELAKGGKNCVDLDANVNDWLHQEI